MVNLVLVGSRKRCLLLCLDALCLGDVVARDVADHVGAHKLCLPPIAVAVVDDLHMQAKAP